MITGVGVAGSRGVAGVVASESAVSLGEHRLVTVVRITMNIITIDITEPMFKPPIFN